MPEKAGEGPPPADDAPTVRYRVPDETAVRRAARRVLRSGRPSYPSQASFRTAVERELRRDDPLAVLGGARLRRLLIDAPGVRLSVRYTERDDDRPVEECPVCGGALQPVRNRTLTGGLVVLGQRCTRCDYWTHRARRVPVRYAFSRGGRGPRGRDPV